MHFPFDSLAARVAPSICITYILFSTRSFAGRHRKGLCRQCVCGCARIQNACVWKDHWKNASYLFMHRKKWSGTVYSRWYTTLAGKFHRRPFYGERNAFQCNGRTFLWIFFLLLHFIYGLLSGVHSTHWWCVYFRVLYLMTCLLTPFVLSCAYFSSFKSTFWRGLFAQWTALLSTSSSFQE